MGLTSNLTSSGRILRHSAGFRRSGGYLSAGFSAGPLLTLLDVRVWLASGCLRVVWLPPTIMSSAWDRLLRVTGGFPVGFQRSCAKPSLQCFVSSFILEYFSAFHF